MKRMWIMAGIFIFPIVMYGQLWDDFSDGDHHSDPAWTGNSSDWVVNSLFQLQTNSSQANSSFYISTAYNITGAIQWEFFVRLQFNPSSANYVDVYLSSTQPELSATGSTGYFIRIGNTQDEISLYRKDANAIVKIIDGTDGITNSSDNQMKIKVVRDNNNQFYLYRDMSGSGNSYVSEGSVTDHQYGNGSWFGFLVRQSTSGFFNRHYFDDISISPWVPDTIPPKLVSSSATSPQTVELVFSELLDYSTVQILTNYYLPSFVFPTTASLQPGNKVILHFSQSFLNGQSYQLNIKNLKDLSGNPMMDTMVSIEYYLPKRFDVLIHEIMADPVPEVGLPNAEYIEIRNRSGRALDLSGWKITTSTSSSGPFPPISLQPDSLLIICASQQLQNLSLFGKAVGLSSFPALPNSGSLVNLISAGGLQIHSVEYSDSWYANDMKKNGGWSLEMIDPGLPCAGAENWKASIHASGGSPGKENSIKGKLTDDQPPVLLRTYTIDSLTIRAVFNEPVDSSSASIASLYEFTGGISIISAMAQPPLFREVLLRLSAPMKENIVYTLKSLDIQDCHGNQSLKNLGVKCGMPSTTSWQDVVINEILFNPAPNGYDYVELFNQSNRIADLSHLYLANRNTAGNLNSLTRIRNESFLFFPGDYIVLTENLSSLSKQYHVKEPGNCLTLSLPSMPDDKGTVVVSNQQGEVIDEVNYSDDWHFPLLKDKNGVSLERIRAEENSQLPANWQSAASSAGFGTPGYLNSQNRSSAAINVGIVLEPKVFSPDLDGTDDYMLLHYHVEEPGYMMNATVFDARGVPVKMLVKNSLLGLKGSFRWDGLNDRQEKLPIGQYIIFTEIFNLQGKKSRFKNVVVLAGKK